jgi:glycosyltransferase involved in cell wall biosynthesis
MKPYPTGAAAADTSSMCYVLTHFPRLAQTFIAGEISEIERLGVTVVPVALNSCSPDELSTDQARAAHHQTFYVKQVGAVAVVKVVGRIARHSPLGLARLLLRAARTGGSDARRVVWRLLYVIEGALVWDHCSRQGVRHIHAHFGQAPASVAWYAAEVGNLMGGMRWTWSFTIHGFQDFVNEVDARLDLKAANAACVICVSDFTRSQLMRVSDPVHWDKFHVVRCGIDLAGFTFRPPPPVADTPRILVVARVSPEKGHVVLLHAVAALHQSGLTARVEIVGSGDFVNEVRSEAGRLGLAGFVDFLGELGVDDVQHRLVDADVFCLPSFAEGLPVSIMEAMAVGVPVVTTFISGIPELAVHEHTALVVPAGNVAALADALTTVLTKPELRTRLAAAARLAVEAQHNSAANAAKLLRVSVAARSHEADHG